jgi:hypothetical protein
MNPMNRARRQWSTRLAVESIEPRLAPSLVLPIWPAQGPGAVEMTLASGKRQHSPWHADPPGSAGIVARVEPPDPC